MPLCRVKDVGEVTPRFTAGAPFKLEIAPPDGIITELLIASRGDHTTNITTAQIDGEANIFSALQVTFQRRGLPPVIINVLPRDLKHINSYLEGQAIAAANPTATTGVHHFATKIPLVLPPRLVGNPLEWGLDTTELAGPILLEGTYGAVTDLGTGATVVTNILNVSVCTRRRPRRGEIRPSFILAMNQNRIQHESAARQGPTTISTGNLEALWGIFLRQHDVSAQAAQRVDGLITRFIIDHSEEGILNDEFFQTLQKRSGNFFKLAAADLPVGTAFPVFSERGRIQDMPILMRGRTLKMIHDSVEVLPVEVTDVTPAANDAFYAIPIGVQLTAAAAARGQGVA